MLSIILSWKVPIIFTKNSEDTANFICLLAKKKEIEYIISPIRTPLVKAGDHVEKGQLFTDGSADLSELFKYSGKEKGEISLLEMFERIWRELNRKEYERNENFDGYDDNRIRENLSAHGKERFANYFTSKIDKTKDLSKYISFDAITLGGSGNEGLGAPETY